MPFTITDVQARLFRPRNPIICSVMSTIIGMQLTFGPGYWFRSTSYDLPFTLGKETWGVAFMFAGIAGCAMHRHGRALVAYCTLLAVFLAWTFCAWLSLFTGTSGGYTGPVLWSGICVMLGNSIERFGSGQPRQR